MKKSWLTIPQNSDFTLYNIPFGIFSVDLEGKHKIGTRIGDFVIDLSILQSFGVYRNVEEVIEDFDTIINAESLNLLMTIGNEKVELLRQAIIDAFIEGDKFSLNDYQEHYLHLANAVQMHLPFSIGDYTDFFSSKEHATNTGLMFRDPANALLPNWLHIPVGYHGRSSSIVISGTDLHRPKGQILPPEGGTTPIFSTSKRLDFELEMAFAIGKPSNLGDTISTKEAEDHIFGMTIFNDWSARDIQQWEYVPLGPFLGKNFGSSLSPWVVTLAALEPFRIESPMQDPKVLPYLEFEGKRNFDINLEVWLVTKEGVETRISASNFKYLYWNMAQQLAHHTINGCNVRTGDLMASGTISGPTPDSYGSMLELSWKGTKSIPLSDGSERKFLQDEDTIVMKAWCEKDGIRVGFGEVSGKILPAKNDA